MTQLSETERDELTDAARRLLDVESSSLRVRSLLDDEDGIDRRLWSQIADLGWLAVNLPAEHGGMGASYGDLAVILQELGRHVTPSPMLASVVLGAGALMASDNEVLARDLLPLIAAGEAIVTVANAGPTGSYEPQGLGVTWRSNRDGVVLDGEARFVPDAHLADWLIVSAADGAGRITLAAVERGARGLRVRIEPSVDQTRRLGRVSLDGVRVASARLLGEPGSMERVHDRVTCIGALAVMCDALGAAERMLEVSAQYAKQRLQFGRPIGSFQAVKHHCANMVVAVEGARAAVHHGFEVLDDPAGDVAEAAAVTSSFGGPACRQVCELAIQVHGGIGFTWEHDAHLHLKRATLDEALFGSSSWHRRRLANRLLSAAGPTDMTQ